MKDKFFVPFQTAKALKEKGYPQYSEWVYYSDGNPYHRLNCVDDSNSTYAAPTYHEVEDWLEGKGQIVQAGRADENWYGLLGDACDRDVIDLGSYSTREEALNAAILKALELI